MKTRLILEHANPLSRRTEADLWLEDAAGRAPGRRSHSASSGTTSSGPLLRTEFTAGETG
jgi:hypothetical protein